MKKIVLIGSVCWALLGLTGCVTRYEIHPQPNGTQVRVDEGQMPVLRSTKVHQVDVGVVDSQVLGVDRLRFVVAVSNRGSRPFVFSPAQVDGEMQGRRLNALSHEFQLRELEDRIQRHRSDLEGSYRYPCCVREGVAYSRFDDQMLHRMDLQQAYSDLEHFRQFALQAIEVKPGETVRGEVVLVTHSKSLGGDGGRVLLSVRVPSEVHVFDFLLQERR